MFKIRFISAHLWLLFILCTVFVKIYQYNLYIKITYEYQRLGRRFAALEKERNELLVCFYEQRQPIKLMQEAEKLGMQPLQLDTIITTTQVALVDFVGTGSTAQALELCGIPIIFPNRPVGAPLFLALRAASFDKLKMSGARKVPLYRPKTSSHKLEYASNNPLTLSLSNGRSQIGRERAVQSADKKHDLEMIAARLSSAATSLPTIAFATTNNGDLGNFIIEKV